MKKYILFDLDGTITDPKEGITKAVQIALSKFGIIIDDLDELCKFIGPPLKDAFKEFYDFSDKDADLAVKYFREYFETRGLYENILFDGFDEFLRKLRDDGKILIVATSKPTKFSNIILEHFNVIKYFQYVSGSTLDGSLVKKGDIIRHALDVNNIIDMSEVIMIGDRKHDIIGAKENNIDSIGVLYGYGSYDELHDSGADYIVKDIDELYDVLNLV